MKLIVARNKLGYIGGAGKMLWHSTEDFKHFKKMTMGCTMVVGKTTFERCLDSVQLPGRATLVIGTGAYTKDSTEEVSAPIGERYLTPWQAMDCVALGHNAGLMGRPDWPYKNAWVIGGKQIYDLFVHFCDEIHMSLINDSTVGDVKWDVPEGYRGKVFYYEFEANKPKDEKPRVDTERSTEDKEHVNDAE